MLLNTLTEQAFHDRIIAVTDTHCGAFLFQDQRPRNVSAIISLAPAFWAKPGVSVTSALATQVREFCFMPEKHDWSARNSRASTSAKRRTWSLLAAGKIPVDDLKLKMELQGWKCMYCKDVISLYTAHIDHVQPLSQGGEHYLYNIVLACSICNLVKSARSLKTFCKKMRFDYEAIKQEIAEINHQLHTLVFGEDWKPGDELPYWGDNDELSD